MVFFFPPLYCFAAQINYEKYVYLGWSAAYTHTNRSLTNSLQCSFDGEMLKVLFRQFFFGGKGEVCPEYSPALRFATPQINGGLGLAEFAQTLF